MILLPKLKYEHLLKKIGKDEDTVSDDQRQEIPGNNLTDTTRSESIDDTSQWLRQ